MLLAWWIVFYTNIYVMLMITNFIEPCMGKLILNHLVGIELDFWTGFFKLTLGSDCLEPFFGPVAFKIILTQWYCKNTNSLNMLSLNLTPKFSFTSRFRMFIINVYYTKIETLVVLLLTLRDSNWLILNCTLQSYKLITLLLSGYNLRKHMPYLDRSM